MSVAEDDIAKEAFAFVCRDWFHDRLLGARQHPPRFGEIEQQRAETVAILGISAVINFQPSLFSTGSEIRPRPRARYPTCLGEFAQGSGGHPSALGQATRRAR